MLSRRNLKIDPKREDLLSRNKNDLYQRILALEKTEYRKLPSKNLNRSGFQTQRAVCGNKEPP